MNNSYIYIYHVNVTQTVPDISPLMPMHQDPLLVCLCGSNWVLINGSCSTVLITTIYATSHYKWSFFTRFAVYHLGQFDIFWITDRKGYWIARTYDDVIKWKHFPRYWPFVRGIHRGPVNSLHKGQWRGALMFSLICVWINGWVSNREAGDVRRHRAHYEVTVMICLKIC